MEIISKLADHFRVTVASLVGEDPEAAGADEQLMRMFRQAGALEEQDLARLDDMIQLLLKHRRSDDDAD